MPFSHLEMFLSVFGRVRVQISRKNSKCSFAIRSRWNRKPEDTPQPKHNLHPQNAPNWRSQVPGSNKNWQKYKTHPQFDFDETENQSTHYSQITTSSLNNAFRWCFMLFREATLYIAHSFRCTVLEFNRKAGIWLF